MSSTQNAQNNPVNVNGVNWRGNFVRAVNKILENFRRGNDIPETLTLPVTRDSGMFEYGGTNDSLGYAMVVATPTGRPSWPKMIDMPRANSTHALVKVWQNSLVALGTHKSGTAHLAVYRVVETQPPVKDAETGAWPELGAATLELVYSEMRNEAMQHISLDNGVALKQLVAILKTKLFMPRCKRPLYVQLLNICSTTETKTFMEFLRSNGLYGDVTTEDRYAEFKDLYTELIEICNELKANYRYVKVVAEAVLTKPVVREEIEISDEVVNDDIDPVDEAEAEEPVYDSSAPVEDEEDVDPIPRRSKSDTTPMEIQWRIFIKKSDNKEAAWTLAAALPPLEYTQAVFEEIMRYWGEEYGSKLLPRTHHFGRLRTILRSGSQIYSIYDYKGK